MKLAFIILSAALIGYSHSTPLSRKCQIVLRNDGPEGEDVCHQPFASFLDCIAERVEYEIDAIIEESSPANQNAAAQCIRASCAGSAIFEPEHALDTFVPCQYPKDSAARKANCPWRYAADEIFGLLKNMPKPVSKCMIGYFKTIAADKIEQCTREHEPRVSPQFNMPDLPGLEDLEFEDLENVLLYHIMSRHYVGQCKCDGGSSSDQNRVVNCLGNLVNIRQDLCPKTRECENNYFGQFGSAGGSCSQRYKNIKKSACSCLDAEIAKFSDSANWKELKDLFVRGGLECNLQKCYIDSGLGSQWPATDQRLKDLKNTVVKAFISYQSGGLPPSLQDALFVFKQIFDEVKDKVYNLLCGDCSTVEEDERQDRVVALNNLWSNKKCGDYSNSRPVVIPANVPAPARASASGSSSFGSDFDDFWEK